MLSLYFIYVLKSSRLNSCMENTTEKTHRTPEAIIIEWAVFSNTINRPVTGEELDQFGLLISPELKIWILLRQMHQDVDIIKGN